MKAFITQTLKELKKPFSEFFRNLSHFLNKRAKNPTTFIMRFTRRAMLMWEILHWRH